MFDLIEPIGMPDAALEGHLKVCPKCETKFSPKRSNQKFCARTCQKVSSNNATRSTRVGEHKKRNAGHYERAARLAEMVYTVAPTERLGVMKHILSFVNQDARLRNILTDPKLLRQEPRADGKKNIAKAASAYTMMFFGVSIKTYLKQVREGTVNENHPVSRKVNHGPVPKLTKIKKVKCWHCPLPKEAMEANARRFDEDMARVADIVTVTQAKVDTYVLSQIQAAANF